MNPETIALLWVIIPLLVVVGVVGTCAIWQNRKFQIEKSFNSLLDLIREANVKDMEDARGILWIAQDLRSILGIASPHLSLDLYGDLQLLEEEVGRIIKNHPIRNATVDVPISLNNRIRDIAKFLPRRKRKRIGEVLERQMKSYFDNLGAIIHKTQGRVPAK